MFKITSCSKTDDENPAKFHKNLREAAAAVSEGKLVLIGIHYGAIKFLMEKKLSRAMEIGGDGADPSVIGLG